MGSLIKAVLDAFDPYGYHYTTAHNIANFEYALASVSVHHSIMIMYIIICASLQHWVSKTELHNATAMYNPMTLDELAEIFSMVCIYLHIRTVFIVSVVVVLSHVGLDKLFQQIL